MYKAYGIVLVKNLLPPQTLNKLQRTDPKLFRLVLNQFPKIGYPTLIQITNYYLWCSSYRLGLRYIDREYIIVRFFQLIYRQKYPTLTPNIVQKHAILSFDSF